MVNAYALSCLLSLLFFILTDFSILFAKLSSFPFSGKMFGRGSGSVQDPACYEHIEEKSNEDFKVEEAPRKTVPSLKRLPFWSLISPWKISTFILLVYSVFSIISIESECKPWSPTDLSKILH